MTMPLSDGKHLAGRASKKDCCIMPSCTWCLFLRLILASNALTITWSFSVLTTSLFTRNYKTPLMSEIYMVRRHKEPSCQLFLFAGPERNQIPDNEKDNENTNPRNREGKNDGDDDSLNTSDIYGGLAPVSSLLDRIKNGANYSEANIEHDNKKQLLQIRPTLIKAIGKRINLIIQPRQN